MHTLENQSWSTAADVNSFGLVAGTVGLSAPATASLATTAVVWAPDAVLDLNQIVQPIDGLTLTAAVAINELGQVLCAGGRCVREHRTRYCFRYWATNAPPGRIRRTP